MQSVYQTAHCLNQDVVGLCDKKYANELPRASAPCPLHLFPWWAGAHGGRPENRTQSQRKTGEEEAARINQISPTELFKKHTTKNVTPKRPASKKTKNKFYNRMVWVFFLMLKKLKEFWSQFIYSQCRGRQWGFKTLPFSGRTIASPDSSENSGWEHLSHLQWLHI